MEWWYVIGEHGDRTSKNIMVFLPLSLLSEEEGGEEPLDRGHEERLGGVGRLHPDREVRRRQRGVLEVLRLLHCDLP